MHLVEILGLRPVPASAVFLALTRRCPLTCRHCSTSSLMSSEEHPETLFRRFVDTFTPQDRPEVVLMSGGEALLRPGLVRWIAERARAAGARSYVLSGMFFARAGRIPRPIQEAIDAVDHFAASLDAFHEEQVPRDAVLRVLERLADEGKQVSVQLVGVGDDDPYLEEATEDIRRTLGDRVPMLVGHVGPAGRAAEWLPGQEAFTHRPLAAMPSPCALAAWPMVAFDGTVVGCCNQDVVDLRAPSHLRLGHVAEDDWTTIRSRCLTRPLLRAIRVLGPMALADQSGTLTPRGYCETCFDLSDHPASDAHARAVTARPTFALLEREVERMQVAGGAAAFARRFGSRRYADLVRLGHQEVVPCAD